MSGPAICWADSARGHGRAAAFPGLLAELGIQYAEKVSNPDRYRPHHCPQCPALQPLMAHGFYSRTLAEAGFDGSIRVRRYLCRSCRRAEEIAARHYEIPASQRTSVSVDTLLDWALRDRNGGFEALAPQPRPFPVLAEHGRLAHTGQAGL